MNILQIHTKMASGGIEAFICALANELCKLHIVTVCTIFKPNVDDVFYKKMSTIIKKTTIGKLNYGFSIREIFRIYNLVRTGSYDVVHIHGCFQYYFLAVLLLHRKTRFFYTIHSDARMENQKWDWRLFWLKRFMFKKKWIVPITISEHSQESFRKLYNCQSELVYNGTPRYDVVMTGNVINTFRYTNFTQIFLHVGRITKAKNQIILCKVFDRLIKEGKDVVLVIAGSPEEKYIYDNIKFYFSDRIIYLGERSDIPELLANADAFCLPSIWEGMPIALLEALSVGCIPICAPVGGIVDVINSGDNGLLSVDSTEEEYYKTICTFMTMPNEKKSMMRNAALNSFNRYSMDTCSHDYMKIYEKYR